MVQAKAKSAAKTKTTTVITRESDGANTELEIGGGADDTAPPDVLSELLGIEADGITYKVYLMPSKPGDKLTYCAAYSKETLSLDAIRDTFGGGTYRIIGYNAKNQFETQKSITLFGFAKPASAPAAAGASGDSMAMMLKMFESQSAMLSAVLQRPSTPAPASGPTFAEILQMIKALEPKDKTDPVEMLLKGLTLGKELGGDGGGGDSLMGLAGKGFDALKPLIAAQAMKADAVAPAAAPRSLPPAASTPAPIPKTREEIEQMNMMKKLTWLQHITADLIGRAMRGKDPELYAEVFLDNLPSYVTLEEIGARFKDQNAIAQLAQLNPHVAEHAAWFESFRQSVLELLAGDDDLAPPLGNGAGAHDAIPD